MLVWTSLFNFVCVTNTTPFTYVATSLRSFSSNVAKVMSWTCHNSARNCSIWFVSSVKVTRLVESSVVFAVTVSVEAVMDSSIPAAWLGVVVSKKINRTWRRIIVVARVLHFHFLLEIAKTK
eukprot:10431270-Ditylum_brightwellii.AAC.1